MGAALVPLSVAVANEVGDGRDGTIAINAAATDGDTVAQMAKSASDAHAADPTNIAAANAAGAAEYPAGDPEATEHATAVLGQGAADAASAVVAAAATAAATELSILYGVVDGQTASFYALSTFVTVLQVSDASVTFESFLADMISNSNLDDNRADLTAKTNEAGVALELTGYLS
jgi:hypothetical protein